MREYDDYIRLTRQYLKKYNQLKIAVQNLDDEIRAQEMLLENESIPSVRYGDDAVSGGSGELNVTEAAADRRIKAEKRIERMRQEKNELERILRKIDRALDGVSDLEGEIIRERYMEGRSWMEIAKTLNYTEKWTRDKGSKALYDIALMVYGGMMRPVQLKIKFEN
nr:MAG TPA: Protein of unknown function (DUF722) [Caudoviricetes sp.]